MMDIKSMTYFQLKALNEEVQKALMAKREERANELWEAIVQAVANYTNEIGSIMVLLGNNKGFDISSETIPENIVFQVSGIINLE